MLDCQTRNSERVFEKKEQFPKGRGGGGGLQKWNSEGMGGGGRAFWNFRRQGGVKFQCHPWYGTDIFWNGPLLFGGNLHPIILAHVVH